MNEQLEFPERPTQDKYFMSVAFLVASRATCLRRHYGAVLVVDRQIVSTGYCGAPRGMTHCADLGCLRDELGIAPGERYEMCRSVHAEANAIIQAARAGVAIHGADMYVSGMPCYMCAKQIVNAGVQRVFVPEVQEEVYFVQTRAVFQEAGVELINVGEG